MLYVPQVFVLERTTTILKTGIVPTGNRGGLSSRSPTDLPPEALLEAIRLHWTIENTAHWARVVNGREDQWRVRTGDPAHLGEPSGIPF